MGKSRTPKYRIEFEGFGQPVGIDRKVKLEDYISNLVDSMKIGGVNQHISKQLGYIPVPRKATLIHQRTGVVVEMWVQPMFYSI